MNRPRVPDRSWHPSFEQYIKQLELAGRVIRPADTTVSAKKIAIMAHRLGPAPAWREAHEDTRGG